MIAREDRRRYLEALVQADTGRSLPFLELVAESVNATQQRMLDALG